MTWIGDLSLDPEGQTLVNLAQVRFITCEEIDASRVKATLAAFHVLLLTTLSPTGGAAAGAETLSVLARPCGIRLYRLRTVVWRW